MRLALMTEPQLGGGYDDLSWAARSAAAAGLEAFARSDHYYWRGGEPEPAIEAFSSLAGLARETERIRLTVLVSPITFRHPSHLAKAAATIDQMSGGRFDLGVGTGWMEEEHEVFGLDFPPWAERFARLEEALAYLRAAFRGESFEGEFYRMTAQVFPRPSGLRLIVGGTGTEKTPALAGRYADELNVSTGPYGDLQPRFDVMREAARAAGRNPEEVTLSVMGPAIVVSDQSSLDALLAEAAALRGVSIDDLVERWTKSQAPFGTIEQVREALGRLGEQGVDKYYLQWFRLTDHDGIANLLELTKAL